MLSVQSLVRPNILQMETYSSARDEYQGPPAIFLDANESPFGTYNRYPDARQTVLKSIWAEQNNVHPNQVFIGNGSDEIIDLCYRVFCRPGTDVAYQFSPTYGMYAVLAQLNDVRLQDIPLDRSFRIRSAALPAFPAGTAKLLFVCSPNNPTGNAPGDIIPVIESFPGIVVVDEAYIDFSNQDTSVRLLQQYPNLLVLRTLSKARGLAAARIGIAMADEAVISLLNKVKPPYNVSRLNQEAAIAALKNTAASDAFTAILIAERERVRKALSGLTCMLEVYPSDANFLLCRVNDPAGLYDYLVNRGIIVRNRNRQVPGCLRISIGTPLENEQLIQALNNYQI
ncbi:MAG: histidinol-phosphate transaminase [Chitinophagaceae bacterium]